MLIHLLATLSVLLVSRCPHHTEAQELRENPDIYFGGEGHQEYLDWALSPNTISQYDNSVFLPSVTDPANGVAVHWHVTGPDDSNIHSEGMIHLAVAAKAKGWVAFGISENGGMFGSDIVAWEAAKEDQLRDLYTRDQFAVYDDSCNHWTFVSSRVEGDFIIFEATRALDTGDTQDRAILYDRDEVVVASSVIAAWGDGPAVGYHGKSVARGAIRWFGIKLDDDLTVSSTSDSDSDSTMTAFEKRMKDVSDGHFEILAGNHTIEAIETAYVDFCLSRSQALSAAGLPDDTERFTIVGFEPFIEQKNADFVHHFTVMSSQEANDDPNQKCEDGRYMTNLYVWAPGGEPFALPENVGLNFSPDSMQSFNLQIHYNNPSLAEGAVDNSGVRLYFSMEQREHEMGVYQFGDVLIRLGNSTVGEGLSEHSFYCPPGCSTMALGTEKVTALRETIHMHTNGIRGAVVHSRDGEKIREVSVDYFDYNQGQSSPHHQFEIHPGDSFSVSCFYDAKNDTKFGFATADEMCVVFMYYYPRQEISIANGRLDIPWMCTYGIEQFGDCETEYQTRKLASEDELNRVFGSSSGQCTDGDEVPSDQTSPPAATDSDSGAFGRPMKFLFPLMSFVLFLNWY